MSELPRGLQNAIGASRRELSPSETDRARVWQRLAEAGVQTGEPVELGARVRAIGDAPAKRSGAVIYLAAASVAIAAGALGYVATKRWQGTEGNRAAATSPYAPTSLASVVPSANASANDAKDAGHD